MLQSCILKITILKKKKRSKATTQKTQLFSPSYFTEDFLSAFPFSFLIHSSPAGLCWGGYEDTQAETLFAFFSQFGLTPVPLCGLGNVKKWPCGKLGCDLIKQQQLPAWLLGVLFLLHGKCEAAYPTSTDKLFYVYLRVGVWVYRVIAAWLMHWVATSWLSCWKLFLLCWWCYAGARSLPYTLVLLWLQDHSSTMHFCCCHGFPTSLFYLLLQLWSGKRSLELLFKILS